MLRGIPFERQKVIHVVYKDQPVGEGRLDILVANCLIIELKAVESLLPIHMGQVLCYLKVTGYELALLLNFNVPSLGSGGIKRVVLS
jgi:GxxExxY protein